MQCRHTICHQCEDAGLVSLREEYEIMREENEKLRALLAETRDALTYRRERDEARAKLTMLERHYSPEAAAKLRAELAAANAEIASLRWDRETACENTPTKDCECPDCGLARERAEVERLQAEVRKQVFGSRVVFDREVVERAQLASSDLTNRIDAAVGEPEVKG